MEVRENARGPAVRYGYGNLGIRLPKDTEWDVLYLVANESNCGNLRQWVRPE